VTERDENRPNRGDFRLGKSRDDYLRPDHANKAPERTARSSRPIETLSPAERLAFVLHDVFDVPFDEVAGVVGKSPAATRQLASRGRRRVRVGAASRSRADESW
jgi:DNA-directed RNA polymerase specialized sigma24 family protein